MSVSDETRRRQASEQARDKLNLLVREPMTPPKGLTPETDYDSKGRYRGNPLELRGSPNDPTAK